MSPGPRRDVATILEALPYIRDFHGRTIVIKYGGAAMIDPRLKEEFARDIVLLKYVGMNPIVVHGGGPEITRYMERLGMKVEFVEGLRVSDADTVEVAKMVLVGKQNKDIVLLINRHGQPAVGLCGDDGLLFRVRKQLAAGERDIGFVGEIEHVDVNVLNHIAEDYIPVVASVGADSEGNSYNVNADAAASAVASALRAFKVIFLTDVEGWLADPADPDSRHLGGGRRRGAGALDGVSGGMRPKLEACVNAVEDGVGAAHIIDGRAAALAAARAVHRRRNRNEDLALSLADLQSLERDWVMPTYVRQPVEFVRGEGCRLWDAEGNEYLDFLAGISVAQIGHCHPALVEAIREQAGRLIHVSQPLLHGAVDAARQAARRRARWAARSSSATRAPRPTSARSSSRAGTSAGGDIVVLTHGFHGRTYGALSATPQEPKQAPFAPLVPGFKVVGRQDANGLAAAVDDGTAAVIIEPVQGESGIHPIADRGARGRPRGVRHARRAARVRRGAVRHGTHRHALGIRADRRAARRDDAGEGPGRRAADRRLRDLARIWRHAPAGRPRLHLRGRARSVRGSARGARRGARRRLPRRSARQGRATAGRSRAAARDERARARADDRVRHRRRAGDRRARCSASSAWW